MFTRSRLILVCVLGIYSSGAAEDLKEEEFLPEKENLDDVGDALKLAERQAGLLVEDFRARFRAVRVVQESGFWRCSYEARKLVNKDRSKAAFDSRHFVVNVEIATGKVTMTAR